VLTDRPLHGALLLIAPAGMHNVVLLGLQATPADAMGQR
jgi:hypothetical protein